jgi:hypothetical protein
MICRRELSKQKESYPSYGEEFQGRRAVRKVTKELLSREKTPARTFEACYPNIAKWVQDGWIEIGRDNYSRSFVRALDIGGLVWEGTGQYATLDEALRALDDGIAAWLKENG